MERFQRFGTEVFVSLKNFRTEIDGDVKDAIDEIASARGMTIRAIAEKTFGWLSKQPLEVQAVILGQIPSDPDFVELVLRRLAAAKPPARTPSPKAREGEPDVDVRSVAGKGGRAPSGGGPARASHR